MASCPHFEAERAAFCNHLGFENTCTREEAQRVAFAEYMEHVGMVNTPKCSHVEQEAFCGECAAEDFEIMKGGVE
jgi:hypothetical protein